MPDPKCEHKDQGGRKFCADCGEQLVDEREDKFVDRIANAVITKLRAPAPGKTGGSLLEDFLSKRKT